ncbi:hypothetical protein A2G06_08455 [Geobacter anodireducens]|nr:hypothetical protein A2G06_08455 [Geobacter anodireducens]
MDKKQAQQLIHQLFTQAFDSDRYQHFLRNLLNHFEPRDGHYTGNYIPDAFKQHVNQYWRIGKYVDPEGDELDLLVVEVKSLSKLERARSALRNFAVNRLKQFEKEASLIAFYAQDDAGADWRFSFVKIEHEAYKDDKGKVKLKQELTPARRYSYLVGVHENSHTACKQLLPVLTMDYADPRIEEIEAAFSIEKITDEFFDQYKALFQKLAEHLKKQRYFMQSNEEETDQAVSRFAKKLLGQIVFLYFLQKKGWLGAAKGQKWGEGSKRFLRERYDRVAKAGGNYYRDFLQYLFYEALASERKDQDDAGYYPRFACRVPFLNGGLFEAEYDWQNETIDIPNSLFNNDEKTKAGDTGTGILDVFDRYNFTIKEDEPLDKEVAVDPEMLGKVFENMLEITERKSKGAFYTPREIVHYMCQESLIHYLDNRLNSYATSYEDVDSPQTSLFGNTGRKGQLKLTAEHQNIKVPKEDLETLIRKGHLALENDTRVLSKGKETETYKFQLPEAVRSHAREIDAALADIKVCDPAIGSGAFPVGLLHEIVNARLALSPHSGNNQSAYNLKRHAIAESIYGVDIDASAIDIARLRLWLSLIVDEEDYREDKALPNLDYKIVRGDSLIGFPENWQSPAADKVEVLKNKFFAETDHDRKAELKAQIDDEISKRMAGSKDSFGYQVNFDFRLFFSEVWHQKGGFDVVIGNPPYLRIQGIRQANPEIAETYKRVYKAATGSFDLYVLFMERGCELIHERGVLNYINPDKWVNASFGKGIRSLVSKKQNAIRLISFGAHQVFSACTYSSLVWIGKTKVDALNYMKFDPDTSTKIDLGNELGKIAHHSFTKNCYENLGSEPWILTHGNSAKVMNHLSSMEWFIKHKLKIFVGLQTSKDSVYFLRNAERNGTCYTADSLELGKRIRIEDGLVKPLLLGDQVHRYQPLDSTNLVVFPYLLAEKDGKARLMSAKHIQQKFPLGWAYLKECEAALRGRENGRFDNTEWFQFGRKQGIDFGSNKKLLAPDISLGGNFSYDPEGIYYTTTTLYGYLKQDGSWESYEYWLAILNSTLLWFYLKNSGSVLANGYYRYKPAYLENFPVPEVNKPDERNISQLSHYLLELNASTAHHKIAIAYFEQLIDGVVYELYFPSEIKAAGKEILSHLGELSPITDPMNEEEKLAIIHREFERLYDPRHPVRNHLETLDSVEVVRTIREALKR